MTVGIVFFFVFAQHILHLPGVCNCIMCGSFENKVTTNFVSHTLSWKQNSIFTRKSSYCFQRILAIAVLSVCPFVHLSVTWVDQSKRCKLGLPNLHYRLPGRL